MSRGRGRGPRRPQQQQQRPPDQVRSYSSAATEDDAISTEGMTFWLDGIQFTCHGRLSVFDLGEFASRAEDAGPVDNINDPGVIRIIADFLHGMLGDPTYADVTRHRRQHKTPDGVMQQVVFDLITDAAGRPTVRPSPSPAGRSAPPSPPAVSPSPAGPPAAAVVPAARQRAVMAALAAVGDITFADLPDETEPETPEREPVIRRVSLGHPDRPVTVEPMTETG
jgi:hypothetical protein